MTRKRRQANFTLRVVTSRANPANDILVADALCGFLLKNAIESRRAVEDALVDTERVERNAEADEIREQIKFLELRLREVAR